MEENNKQENKEFENQQPQTLDNIVDSELSNANSDIDDGSDEAINQANENSNKISDDSSEILEDIETIDKSQNEADNDLSDSLLENTNEAENDLSKDFIDKSDSELSQISENLNNDPEDNFSKTANEFQNEQNYPDDSIQDSIDEMNNDAKTANQTSKKNVINVRPVKFQQFKEAKINRSMKKNLDIMQDVSMHITVELGRTKSSIRDVMDFEKGSIVELNKIAGEQVEIFVNGKLSAKGEVIVIEDKFGVRITTTNFPKENF